MDNTFGRQFNYFCEICRSCRSCSRPTHCKTWWAPLSWTLQWQTFARRQHSIADQLHVCLFFLTRLMAVWVLHGPKVWVVIKPGSQDWLDEGARIYLNDDEPTDEESLEILHTPGHTPDSISLWPRWFILVIWVKSVWSSCSVLTQFLTL